MLIKSVELENIKSYAFAKIALGPGVTAILGENGAGKSTILEAVGFALFDHRNGKLGDLLREGAQQGRVVITMVSSLDAAEYMVERVFSSKATLSYQVYHHGIVANGAYDVMRWLREHMGVPPEAQLGVLFENTIGVTQGTFTAPFLLAPAGRKAIFDPLLRVEEYRKASDNLRPTVRQLKEKKAALDTEIARMQGVLTVLPGLREEDKEIGSALLRLGTAQALRKQQVSIAETKLIGLDKAAKRVDEANQAWRAGASRLAVAEAWSGQVESAERDVARIEQEIAETEARVQEINADLIVAHVGEQQIQRLQAEIDQSRELVATAKEATTSFRTEWKGLKRQLDVLDSETGVCPTCGTELTAEHCDALGSRNMAEMSLLCAQAETQKQIASNYEEAIIKLLATQGRTRASLRELASRADLSRADGGLVKRLAALVNSKAALGQLNQPPDIQGLKMECDRLVKEGRQAKAGYDAEEHTKVQAETSRLQQELAGVGAQLKEKGYRLTVVKDSIKALEITEKELAAKTAKAAELHKLHSTIESMREILREAGPYVTRRLVRQIGAGAATMFGDLMGQSGPRLQWTEDYEVLVEERGYARPFTQLSGGERMCAALAVRWALAQHTSAIDVMFLDEPTAHLDPERRGSLADAIGQVKCNQLFLISHDSTFESAAENTVRIVKDGGGSHAG